ncbi:MAG: hypothetical protein Q9M91_06735 [Candidatus Dojkabacteria bacterium]|nr:hypothetical protein [Candidatus Dojkabacteria bacterium]MDQ7021491.1 hypothetical protein [Candidatus Dojkabacteria bacterium]
MKNLFKSTAGLILIILFLISCFISVFLIFIASWLHTYKVFTEDKDVAEVVISEIQEDDLGKYFEVTITPIESDQSALSRLFVGEDNPNPDLIEEESETYKLYGDTFEFGGEIIKFKDEFILLNFETAYKFNTISAEYSDDDVENDRKSGMTSKITVGGNDDTYRDIASTIRGKGSFKKSFYKVFIDSVPQPSKGGSYVEYDMEVRGKIVVTNDGFFWQEER